MTKIREIFTSIQGEGPYVGQKQLFVRFCGCNLKCKYCDTDFVPEKSRDYSVDELVKEINSSGEVFTISLTGGEPLVSIDFLNEFLPVLKKSGHKVYLETNGTLPDNLEEIIDFVDVVSADIKLESSTGIPMNIDVCRRFFCVGSKKEIFAKVVFNDYITDKEICDVSDIVKSVGCELILQPEMKGNNFAVCVQKQDEVFEKFYKLYKNVRLIPQMHKFLNVR